MNTQKMNEAKQQMAEWLCDPRELGEKPAKLEYVKTFTDPDGIECMIFKFKKTLLSKWMLGVVSDAGVFSEMQVYNEETAEKDAAECLDWLKTYWKDMEARQSGEGANEYKDETGRFTALILLSDKTWDKKQFRQDMKEDWGIEPAYEDGEDDESGEDRQGCDAEIFEVGTARVVLGFMDIPVPNGEAEQNAAMNYTWKEAVEVTKTHQAHIIVAIIGDHENPIEDGELFVKVIASLCKQKNAVGVNTNGVVYQPQFYFAMQEMLGKGMFPIWGLIWFGVLRTEKGFHAYTIGMNHFGKDDMEILDADEEPNELRDFLIGITEYCIEEDVTLRAGESIGLTADQRCQISRSEGVCIDGMTLKIAYRKE